MRIDPLRATVLAACCLAAGTITTASGQGTGTPPAPGCDGVHLVDKAKDNSQPSTDITNVWFDRAGGKTFANMQVSDLKTELPEGSTQWYWTLDYTGGEAGRFRLLAYHKADGSQGFRYREFIDFPDPAGGAYAPPQNMTGAIFSGKTGVIRWELTDDLGGNVGSVFTDAFAAADEVVAGQPENGSPYLRVVASIDDTTDIQSRPYTVKEACEAPAPGGGGTTPPPPDSPPQQQPPAPGGSPVAPANPGGGQAEKLDLTVSKKVPRARKVRRSLVLRVSSRGGVSGVEAVLSSTGKKGKVVGRGKLASLKGKGKLKLKIAKKIKRGRYTLQIVGRNANGNGGTATVALRFK